MAAPPQLVLSHILSIPQAPLRSPIPAPGQPHPNLSPFPNPALAATIFTRSASQTPSHATSSTMAQLPNPAMDRTIPHDKRWPLLKDTIVDLFIGQDMKIADVAKHMKEMYGFDAQ